MRRTPRVHPAAAAAAMGLLLLGTGCRRDPETGLTGDDGADGADDGDPTGGGDAGSTDSTGGDGDSSDTGATPPKYDVGAIPDAPKAPDNCQMGGGGEETASFIWIANSGQGTVSKIDTVTLEEVGRYYTKQSTGDPSRTSVNLSGDVAVANRNGGIVKFYADITKCEDRDGDGQIQTSTGPDDVLPWDEEECRAWYSDFDYLSQRPIAWTPGEWNPGSCSYQNEMVWTAGSNDNWKGKPGGGGGTGVDVILLDGQSGDVEETINVPEVIPDYFGMYGGAVDESGNFWATQLGGGTMLRVRLSDFEVTTFNQSHGGYGMTVGASGYVWTCDYQVARFDPEDESWEVANAAGAGGGGCMEDAEGTLWVAGDQLVGIDVESLEVVQTYQVGGAQWEYLKGISIDFQGYVWAVPMSNAAYRVDPETGDYETVTGLVNPYTYSDMTGFALASAGGWTPAG